MSGGMRAQPQQLAELQCRTSHIRNFCILAHVDHGKTTLTDSLISSNGIISAKLAGKLRYLDSTEEEQRRGITMQSSAISLLFKNKLEKVDDNSAGAASAPGSSHAAAGEDYLINLIDSPGHIDFSSDVSTATRLCDGAIIIIDAVEGICTQTHAVLYKALKERLKPLLVLNKIDRLCVEMKLSSTEAFYHLRRLLEQINALSFTLLNSEIMKRRETDSKAGTDDQIKVPKAGNGNSSRTVDTASTSSPAVDSAAAAAAAAAGDGEDAELEDDPLVADWTFAPESGNVIFASAIDCWGFGVAKFTTLWAKRLGVNRNVLRKYIFEDYMFNSTTKKIVRCDPSRGGSAGAGAGGAAKPMFASMILDPLWQLYETGLVQQDTQKLVKMAQKAMMIELPPREVNSRDPRSTLQSILRRWLPLSDTILRSVVRVMPGPSEAQLARLFTLLPNLKEEDVRERFSSLRAAAAAVDDAVDAVDTAGNAVAGAGADETTAVDMDSRVADSRDKDLIQLIDKSVERVTRSIAVCDASDAAPVVVFVSKTVAVRAGELSAVDLKMLNRIRREKAAAEAEINEGDSPEVGSAGIADIQPDDEVFLALGRVFSGVLRRNSKLYVLGSRYNPFDAYDSNTIQRVGIAQSASASAKENESGDRMGMYIMLGPSVFSVAEVPAGNVVAILGLEEYILKSATLCSEWAAHPMTAISFQAKPMVKVAVEPYSHQHLRQVALGLKRLHQFDPVVEIAADASTGQSTMTCLGELHLEQCVKALTERFAKCALKISEPIVSYRETVIDEKDEAGTVSSAAAAAGTASSQSSSSSATAAASAMKYLPPPWGDNPELAAVDRGLYRVVHISENVALHLRCFPIHASLASAMEASLEDPRAAEELEASLLRGLQGDGEMSPRQKNFWVQVAKVILHQPSELDSSGNPVAVDVALKYTAHRGVNGADGEELKCQRIIADLRQRILALGSKQSPNCLLLLPRADVVFQIWNLNSLKLDRPFGGASIAAAAAAATGGGGAAASTDRFYHDMSRLAGTVPAVDGHGTPSTIFWKLWDYLHSAAVAGFRLACDAGPLMHEPLHRVGFSIESVEITRSVCTHILSADEVNQAIGGSTAEAASLDSSAHSASSIASPLGDGSITAGQLISEVKEGMHLCVLSSAARVVEPVYRCDIQCDQQQLGNLYAVLSQRRGSVVEEDVIEGSSLFLLTAHLPLQASFGFAQQLLDKTSGLATAPQLQLSHWSTMDMDPFWRPRTEDELEEFGDLTAVIAAQGGQERVNVNLPRAIIDNVRKRKGLPIEEKVVLFAEKQRTLNKKK